MKKKTTSWESFHKWYDGIVGEIGHYYHREVILPKSLDLLNLKSGDNLLDLGCGQGVLARAIPDRVSYAGIDLSSSMIKIAKDKMAKDRGERYTFYTADITKPLDFKSSFSHSTAILVLQNIEPFEGAIDNAYRALCQGGKFLTVINHPCFRIPRQSSWGFDQAKKWQYRRMDRYLTSLAIPIAVHPGQEEERSSWSFHRPLCSYIEAFYRAGFLIQRMEEWISNKQSTGERRKAENLSRREFPLFLAILAIKN